jgi:hypothetical protein
MIEGFGSEDRSGSVSLTNGSGSGRPENIWIRRIRIRSTAYPHFRADLVAHHHRHHPTLPMKTGKKGRRPCHHCGKLVINVALHIRNKHESDPMVGFSGMAQCRQCLENYAVNTDHASQCRFVVLYTRILTCTRSYACFLIVSLNFELFFLFWTLIIV